MKRAHSYILLSVACLFFAFTIFAISNNWIIFTLQKSWHNNNHHAVIEKKQVTLFYFHQKKWKTDTQEILWTTNTSDNIYRLVNAWLTLLDEEKILPKKVTLQSALLSPCQTAYLSFDRTILPKDGSIFLKLMFIEGLLKTIGKLNEPIQSVQFLSHHQQLHDQHLDFSNPWPMSGFIDL